MRRVAPMLFAAGCNSLFGIQQPQELDAPDEPVEPLLVPSAAVPCPTALPAFDTWSYARKAFPNYPVTDNSLQIATFYGVDHAYVGDGHSVYDTAVDGTLDPAPILTVPDMTSVVTLATDPRGEVLWSARGGFLISPNMYSSATYYAIRARQWELHDAVFSLPGPPFAVWPSSVAYYAGTIRMTVSVADTSMFEFHMVELTSTRGYHWTDTHTLDRFSIGDAAPYLSPDGCVLLFTRNDPGTTTPKLYAALRDDSTGKFLPEVKLGSGPDQPLYSQAPALDASKSRLWYFHSFRDSPCCDHSMMEGHP